MIFKSSSPISPTLDISVTGINFDFLSVQQVVLEMGENKHDVLRLLVTGIPPRAVTDYPGAPIRVTWEHGNLQRSFAGYVTHVSPSHDVKQGLVNRSPIQSAWVWCMGASFKMKAKKTRLWEDVTLEGVVSELSFLHNFSYAIPKDSFSFSRRLQSGESDWEFLSSMVSDLGYQMTFHGTHLHVFDRMKALGRKVSYTTIVVPGRTSMVLGPGQLIHLDGDFGTFTPRANNNIDTISVLDQRGVITTLVSDSTGSRMGKQLGSDFTDTLAITSQSSAHAERVLRKRQQDKFPYSARMEVTGTLGVIPGGVIDLNNLNSDFDGLWYVTDVVQTLSKDKYYSELTVIKDTKDGIPFTPPTERVGVVPAPVLRGRVWEASRQSGTVYV